MNTEQQIAVEFVTWARENLSVWQHEAFRQLLKKGELDASDFDAIYAHARIVLGVDKKKERPSPKLLTLSEFSLSPPTTERIRLKELQNLQNVNAVKGGESVKIGDTLTVIYGENAAGKSGYARVAKQGCRCPAKAIEEVLPNAFKEKLPLPTPQATFVIQTGPTLESIPWKQGNSPNEKLQRFSVFDSKCVSLYSTQNNQLGFAPEIFSLFEKLGATTTDVKRKLLDSSVAVRPDSNILAAFQTDTKVGKLVSGLSADTDPEDIKKGATWDDDRETELRSKIRDASVLRAEQPEARRGKLRTRLSHLNLLARHIAEKADLLTPERLIVARRKYEEYEKFQRAYELAAKTAVEESEVPGAGTDAWKALLESAAHFSATDAYPGKEFPNIGKGARCVLCQQSLGNEYGQRLKRFWAFIQDDAASKRDAAKTAFNKLTQEYADLIVTMPQSVLGAEDELKQAYPVEWEKTVSLVEQFSVRLGVFREALTTKTWPAVKESDEVALSLWAPPKAAIQEQIRNIRDDNTERLKLRAIEIEILELESRKEVHHHLSTVLDYLDRLKSSATLKAAADSISTRALSDQIKDLHRRFVTKAFRTRVVHKAKELGLHQSRLTVSDKVDHGKVLHGISLDGLNPDSRPSQILSEGERTAVALAYFLSDLGTPKETCGVIFDDPVTSLDHRIRKGVTKALVELAVDRQVIVFTHDLSFFSELVVHAKQKKLVPQLAVVEAFTAFVGQISLSLPQEIRPVKQLLVDLRDLLASAKDADSEGDSVRYDEIVDRFYSRLRRAWERCVEEILFNKVIGRYQREIMTQSLTGVSIDESVVEAVFEGMSVGSERTDAHDHDSGTAMSKATPEQLSADLGAFSSFVTEQKEKRNEMEAKCKHLKAKVAS